MSSEATETFYEYQRFYPISGWSSQLTAVDRQIVQDTLIGAVRLGSEWEWEPNSDWRKVINGRTDRDGWQYATALLLKNWKGEHFPHAFVRRRAYQRRRVPRRGDSDDFVLVSLTEAAAAAGAADAAPAPAPPLPLRKRLLKGKPSGTLRGLIAEHYARKWPKHEKQLLEALAEQPETDGVRYQLVDLLSLSGCPLYGVLHAFAGQLAARYGPGSAAAVAEPKRTLQACLAELEDFEGELEQWAAEKDPLLTASGLDWQWAVRARLEILTYLQLLFLLECVDKEEGGGDGWEARRREFAAQALQEIPCPYRDGDFTTAIAQIDRLAALQCSFYKVSAIRNAMNAITAQCGGSTPQDVLTPALIYCLCMAQVPSLGVQVRFINLLVHPSFMKGQLGVAATTLAVAVAYIQQRTAKSLRVN